MKLLPITIMLSKQVVAIFLTLMLAVSAEAQKIRRWVTPDYYSDTLISKVSGEAEGKIAADHWVTGFYLDIVRPPHPVKLEVDKMPTDGAHVKITKRHHIGSPYSCELQISNEMWHEFINSVYECGVNMWAQCERGYRGNDLVYLRTDGVGSSWSWNLKIFSANKYTMLHSCGFNAKAPNWDKFEDIIYGLVRKIDTVKVK